MMMWPDLTKWLVHREVSLDNKHGSAWGPHFLEHMATPLVQAAVDATKALLRALQSNTKNIVGWSVNKR